MITAEQLIRDIFEEAIKDGLFDHESDPQLLTAGDLVGCANLLSRGVKDLPAGPPSVIVGCHACGLAVHDSHHVRRCLECELMREYCCECWDEDPPLRDCRREFEHDYEPD